MCVLSIDDGLTINLISSFLVKTLGLATIPHLVQDSLSQINNISHYITHQCMDPFSFYCIRTHSL